jgi:hypothetical protein
MRGFASNDETRVVSQRLADIIDELSVQLGLSLKGLDGVTVAHDYDDALAQLVLGFEPSTPLTRTNDPVAQGCAMAPTVVRNGEVMSHLVLSDFILPLIDQPQWRRRRKIHRCA